MIYKDFPDFEKQRVEADIQSGDRDRIINALLSTVLNSGDYKFSQDLIFKLVEHTNEYIRGDAMLSFGHLVRIHRTLDKEKVIPILQKALTDQSEFVRGNAQSALSDINIFYNKKK